MRLTEGSALTFDGTVLLSAARLLVSRLPAESVQPPSTMSTGLPDASNTNSDLRGADFEPLTHSADAWHAITLIASDSLTMTPSRDLIRFCILIGMLLPDYPVSVIVVVLPPLRSVILSRKNLEEFGPSSLEFSPPFVRPMRRGESPF